jgi:hypothetical protein
MLHSLLSEEEDQKHSTVHDTSFSSPLTSAVSIASHMQKVIDVMTSQP